MDNENMIKRMAYKRKNGSCKLVDFYGINSKTGLAIIYVPDERKWENVKPSRLIPEEYAVFIGNRLASKTERNRHKEHLKLVDAIWETTDGLTFRHAEIESAIEHQAMLDNAESTEV